MSRDNSKLSSQGSIQPLPDNPAKASVPIRSSTKELPPLVIDKSEWEAIGRVMSWGDPVIDSPIHRMKARLRENRVKDGIDYAIVAKYGEVQVMCGSVWYDPIREAAEAEGVTVAVFRLLD